MLEEAVLLVFFFSGCFVRPTDGCHVRALQDLEMLIASGHRIAVYSYRNHAQWPWREEDVAAFDRRFPGVELVLDVQTTKLRLLQKLKGFGALVGGRLGAALHRLRLRGATPGLDALRRDPALRLGVVSYPWGMAHLNGPLAPRIIIDTHDLKAVEHAQSGQAGRLSLDTLAALRKEMFFLSLADQVWSISYAESWFIQALLHPHRVRIIPPALEEWTTRADATPTAPVYDLVFVGSDNRWNGGAMSKFLDHCVDWGLTLKIAIAGKVCRNPAVAAAAARAGNVTLLDFVDDLDPLYASSRAAVCPVEGTGAKIKLIESLRGGRPVFAAVRSFAGLIPGYDECVFPLEPRVIEDVLGDPGRLAAAQTASLRYAEAYDFGRVAALAHASIADLLRPSRPVGAPSVTA